jgi:hypothetical protein
MPAVRAALLPHPPLLVPDLAGAAAAELEPLRSACREALRSVLAAGRAIVVVGDGPVWGLASPGAIGSFAPYGLDLQVGLPGAPLPLDLLGLPEPAPLNELPLSLAAAAWLLGSLDRHAEEAPGRGILMPGGRPLEAPAGEAPAASHAELTEAAATASRAELTEAAPTAPRAELVGAAPTAPRAELVGAASTASRAEPAGAGPGLAGAPHLAAATVPAALGPSAAVAVGRELARAAGWAGPVGVVAMGDLSARRSAGAPGAFHPDAAGFDAAVARAVAAGDLDALAALDPGLAAELMVAGRAVLQVLAGAMDRAGPLHGRVLYDDAPYGVGYVAAVLTAEPGAGRRSTTAPAR